MFLDAIGRARIRRSVVCLAVGANLFACTGHKPPAPVPHPRWEATSYATEPLPEPLRGDAADSELLAQVVAACRRSRLTPDGRLAEVALAVAETMTIAGPLPSGDQVEAYARRVGLAELPPSVWAETAMYPSIEALEQSFREGASIERATHCGAAAVRRGRLLTLAAAVSRRPLFLADAIPRRVERNTAVRLRGAVLDGYKTPVLAHMRPDGSVAQSPLEGERFTFYLTPEEPGEHTIELLATGPTGRETLAYFPIAVGVELRSGSDQRAAPHNDTTAVRVREGILGLLTEEREKRGLARLRRDPALDNFALTRTQERLANSPPSREELQRRWSAARVRPEDVLLGLTLRGGSAAELFGALARVPSRRAELLASTASDVGIGVVQERGIVPPSFVATLMIVRRTSEPPEQTPPGGN